MTLSNKPFATLILCIHTIVRVLPHIFFYFPFFFFCRFREWNGDVHQPIKEAMVSGKVSLFVNTNLTVLFCIELVPK